MARRKSTMDWNTPAKAEAARRSVNALRDARAAAAADRIATTMIVGVETLETRRSDRLDFHDVAVWELKAALIAAYEAGRRDGTTEEG